MSPTLVVSGFKLIVLIFLLVQVYTLVSILMSRQDQITVMAKKTIDIAIGKSSSTYLSYNRIMADMSRFGVMYALKDYNLEPSSFVTIKLLCALGTGVICAMLSSSFLLTIALLLIGCVVGFFLPDLLIRINNAGDNEAMQEDILSIYNILKIHARAGVYITDSLIECQRSVAHPRLKQALNEMTNNILASRVTSEEAIDQFNARFANEDIDNLAIIIKQAFRTGRSADLLTDISKQIEINNKIRSEKSKDKQKRQTSIIQVIFFGIITVIIVYLIAMELAVSLGGM